MKNYISHVDLDRCVGCGLCVVTCPDGALRLERKLEELITPAPKNKKEWTEKRAKNRGISLEEIL
jgi:ferredoxin